MIKSHKQVKTPHPLFLSDASPVTAAGTELPGYLGFNKDELES